MKYVYRTVLFHLICILFFGYVYCLLKDDFVTVERSIGPIDCFFLSTTIQSGVGYTLISPTTYVSKLAIMIQQFVMLSVNALLLYFLIELS